LAVELVALTPLVDELQAHAKAESKAAAVAKEALKKAETENVTKEHAREAA